MKRIIFICFIVLVGCAPWARVGGLHKSGSHNFSVELPEGWMRLNTSEYLLVTRDGVLLQSITVKRVDIDEPLEHTKKKFSKGMLPQEVSEVILDNIASDQAVLNFRIIENVPIDIGGIHGFRAVFTFKNKDGLKLKSVFCGFIHDEWFYGIRYTAALRYYFDKDSETFEEVLRSFRLIKTT
jgi:hypothetical protein